APRKSHPEHEHAHDREDPAHDAQGRRWVAHHEDAALPALQEVPDEEGATHHRGSEEQDGKAQNQGPSLGSLCLALPIERLASTPPASSHRGADDMRYSTISRSR